MSELKAFDIVVAEEYYCEGIVKYRRAVYDKSEADKVIAELEESHKREVEQLLMEIVRLKERVHDCKQGRAIEVQEIRHQKHRRCLAMASTCRLRARWFGDNAFYKKEQWALNWYKRWLELAKRFKEAK